MAVQGLLVRLEALAGQEGRELNRTLRLFSDNRLSQVHANSADFERLSAPSGLSGPAAHPPAATRSRASTKSANGCWSMPRKAFTPEAWPLRRH